MTTTAITPAALVCGFNIRTIVREPEVTHVRQQSRAGLSVRPFWWHRLQSVAPRQAQAKAYATQETRVCARDFKFVAPHPTLAKAYATLSLAEVLGDGFGWAW